MIGVVEVFYGGNKIASEPNMIMDNLGEIIADFMSLPRALENIPSASSILDASNYTVRAASLGKDALGYQFHGHSSDLSAAMTADGILRVVSYGDTDVSSYQTSSFYVSTGNKLLPEFSKPTMDRLEERSTQVSYLPNSLDIGHNINYISEDGLPSLGCYAPTGVFYAHILSASVTAGQPLTDNLIVSAVYTNTSGFNCYGTIDSRGFILMDVSNILEGRTRENANVFGGLLMSYRDGWDDLTGDLSVDYILNIDSKDFLSLNFFGGIYTIGLWCYDVRSMLDKGMQPPFTQYDKEQLEYKLVARKTFTRDLTYYCDSSDPTGDIPGIELVQDLKLIWSWKFK